jgi:hypothetical protein
MAVATPSEWAPAKREAFAPNPLIKVDELEGAGFVAADP